MGKQETRQRILKAALALFGEKGYVATSTREIAEKAGVNHLTLFRHFGSKEALFRESVVSHVSIGDFLNEIRERLTGNVKQDLDNICRAFFKENASKGTLMWLWFYESRTNSEVAELFAEIPHHLVDFLSAYMMSLSRDRDENIIQTYRVLSAMFFGQLTQYILWNAHPVTEGLFPETPDPFIKECVDLFAARFELCTSKIGSFGLKEGSGEQ